MVNQIDEKAVHSNNWSKSDLPLHNEKPRKKNNWLLVFYTIGFMILFWFGKSIYSQNLVTMGVPDEELCPILEKIIPNKYVTNPENIDYILHNKEYHEILNKRFQDSINYPTEVYDDMQNPTKEGQNDTRWNTFRQFHTYLEKTYPLVYKNLKVEKVNELGLVYTWKGSNSDKKPIMLTAHQDVVPVDRSTVNRWDHSPFSGFIDSNDFIYGRGVLDCKNLLIGLLNTIEFLLDENKFQPKRTIILAFGYDEESSGDGAFQIGKFLENRYGQDSFLQIIDEGNAGYQEIEGTNFILPATGEKGHLNSVIEIFTPGGHSSVPQSHTSIGIIAQLINEIESSPFEPILTKVNPLMNQLYCLAEHSKIPQNLKTNILKSQIDQKSNSKVVEYLSENLDTKYLITTSQAIDIIEGGVKSNALPEHVSFLVNSRIAVESSVDETVAKYQENIVKVANKFNLGLIIENTTIIEPTENGYFKYNIVEPLNPAPVSPLNESWKIFGGSIRYLFENLINTTTTTTPFVVAPFLSSGNTDTKSYWILTKNIYRYIPSFIDEGSGGEHSVNEKVNLSSHYHIVGFYYYYLQLIDKVEDESFA
ncbi:hypothetical protein KGF54_003396 [Candida jiufengensis]|uniref:uncharacterized protein n=1 Tax=Candida jiufengensis TaxID=497108 RepID=UPI002224112B|nr:uncharacterized protein KGF54_003396 [Candida jiufengensis]KAI5952529.1 hypothetical protein KGF54_003396 [Candida jiufengensis]